MPMPMPMPSAAQYNMQQPPPPPYYGPPPSYDTVVNQHQNLQNQNLYPHQQNQNRAPTQQNWIKHSKSDTLWKDWKTLVLYMFSLHLLHLTLFFTCCYICLSCLLNEIKVYNILFHFIAVPNKEKQEAIFLKLGSYWKCFSIFRNVVLLKSYFNIAALK